MPAQNAAPPPAAPPRIDGAADAAALVGELARIMDALLSIVDEETALVRAGRLKEAADLEARKSELARLYVVRTSHVKAHAKVLPQLVPDLVDALRRRHGEFQALLQINLTVLATAHAVSEGIMRGVAGELARKSAPQTYGVSGRPSAPAQRAAQPVTVNRTL